MPNPRTPQREERILDAATRLVAHYGYDKTSVAEIAAAAGVAKGAVYLHWPSKEALFDRLIVREMRAWLADLLARVEADPQGGRLARLYYHALLSLQANALMRALYTQDHRILGDYMHRQDPSRYTQRMLFGREFLQGLQAAGLVRTELPLDGLVYLLTILSYGYTRIAALIPPEQAPPVDELAVALEELFNHGVARAEGDPAAGKAALRVALAAVERQYEQEEQAQ